MEISADFTQRIMMSANLDSKLQTLLMAIYGELTHLYAWQSNAG